MKWLDDLAAWFLEHVDEVAEVAGPLLNLPVVMIGPIVLYVVQQEEVVLQGKVTRYPVEDRDELADHVFNEPRRINLRAWIGGILPWAEGLDLGGPAIKHIALSWLQRNKVPVWYISRMAVYPNMVVTMYRPIYTPLAQNAFLADIQLEQVKFGKEPKAEAEPPPEEPTDEGEAPVEEVPEEE